MLLGRVIGRVVASVVYKGLAGVPLLLVQPLDKTGQPKGKAIVACDATRMAGAPLPTALLDFTNARATSYAPLPPVNVRSPINPVQAPCSKRSNAFACDWVTSNPSRAPTNFARTVRST